MSCMTWSAMASGSVQEAPCTATAKLTFSMSSSRMRTCKTTPESKDQIQQVPNCALDQGLALLSRNPWFERRGFSPLIKKRAKEHAPKMKGDQSPSCIKRIPGTSQISGRTSDPVKMAGLLATSWEAVVGSLERLENSFSASLTSSSWSMAPAPARTCRGENS